MEVKVVKKQKWDITSRFAQKVCEEFGWTKLKAIMEYHHITGKLLAHTCRELADNSDNLADAGLYGSGISNYRNGDVKWCKLATLRKFAEALSKITEVEYTIDDIDEGVIIKNRT